MAHVHTNDEDRKREQNDHHNQAMERVNNFMDEFYSHIFFEDHPENGIESIFELEEPVKELEPETKTNMPRFDSWCEMSKAERNLYRDISE